MGGRVLVTGASGMLGGATADLLADHGWDVTVMQRRTAGGRHRESLGDIRDPDAVERAVRGQDAVVHLAAKVDVVGPWRYFVDVNVRGSFLCAAGGVDVRDVRDRFFPVSNGFPNDRLRLGLLDRVW